MNKLNKQAIHGFSLMELMVVVLIIGILAAIVFPNYQTYVERTALAQAKQQLLSTKQAVESARLVNPRGFNPKTKLDDKIKKAGNENKRYSFSYALKADTAEIFLQAVPTNENYQFGLWMNQDGTVYKCKGLKGAARQSGEKPANCELS